MKRAPFPVRASYLVLLRAYPASFRQDYEAELRTAFEGRWDDTDGVVAKAALCLNVGADTLWTAARAHAELTMRDLRDAARTFSRHRSHACAALATLAVGIAAVTMVYSVARGVLFTPLPYRDPSRLVMVWAANHSLGLTEFSESVRNFVSLRQRTQRLSGLAALREGDANITGGSEPERVPRARGLAGFFRCTLGFRRSPDALSCPATPYTARTPS